jgi:hypothetical protein
VDGILGLTPLVRTHLHSRLLSAVRIALSAETRKAFTQGLRLAHGTSACRPRFRIHTLVWLPEDKSVAQALQSLGIGKQTVRDWLHAFNP